MYTLFSWLKVPFTSCPSAKRPNKILRSDQYSASSVCTPLPAVPSLVCGAPIEFEPIFDRLKFALPRERSSYNDDIQLEPFCKADFSIAGQQRKGIHEPLSSCKSFDRHVRASMDERFPLSISTPLPHRLRNNALFCRDTPPARLLSIWETQLSKVEKLVSSCALAQSKWDACIPPELLPAAGRLKTVAIKQLMGVCGMGGTRWLDQFAFGFPITGLLSQKFLFGVDDKADPSAILPLPELFKTAASRFRERAEKSGRKNAQPLWDEALEQVKKGWLLPPAELAADGRPASWRSEKYNIAFRFGVLQQDKLRACDDLKHAMTNLACVISTPNQLLSWDHISQLSQLMSEKGGDWVLFKADHESAYKQLPIRPSDMKASIIALRHPSSGKWFGFVTRTLIFGSIAAVLHYNVFSRILAELTIRCLGLPLVIYFDDFAAIIRAQLGPDALRIFTRFCSALGITLKLGKSQVGGRIVFLGLLGSFPCAGNRHKLEISLPAEKRKSWSQLIASFLTAGKISHSCLEKLIGRLLFSQSAVFGKFARTQLRPLYLKLHRRVYCAKLSAQERLLFSWWKQVIEEFTPRISVPRPLRPHWILYTDAATSTRLLCAVLFHGDSSTPHIKACCTSAAPIPWEYLFRHTTLIYGLELLALVAFFEDWAPRLAGSCIWVYLDSNNCLAAIVRGDSDTAVIAILVARFWKIVQRHNICVWFSRVNTKLNPADRPTRNQILPYRTAQHLSFKSLRSLFTLCRSQLHLLPPDQHRPRPAKKGFHIHK